MLSTSTKKQMLLRNSLVKQQSLFSQKKVNRYEMIMSGKKALFS